MNFKSLYKYIFLYSWGRFHFEKWEAYEQVEIIQEKPFWVVVKDKSVPANKGIKKNLDDLDINMH